MNNWFIFSVGILQLLGAGAYIINKQVALGILFFLYALTNFVLFYMGGKN